MPELPDVETFRRRLQAEGARKKIVAVRVRKKRILQVTPGTLRRHLKDKRITKTERHGKWLLARLDGEKDWLALHFGMTGNVVPFDADGDDLPKGASVVLELAGGPSIAFTTKRNLGRIELAKDPHAFAEEHDLGPDALAIGADEFLERLAGRTGAIKAALMNQSILAGVGNVYADEALFHARIDPRTGVADLDEKALRRLHSRLRHVLERAIQAKGDTKRMPHSWITPLRRERSPDCPRCGTSLGRGKVSGRTTVWCPRESTAGRRE